MAQVKNVTPILSSSVPGKSGAGIAQTDANVSSSIEVDCRVETDEGIDETQAENFSDSAKKESLGTSGSNDEDPEQKEESNDEEINSDNEYDFYYDSDDPMEFGNFGLNDPNATTMKLKEETIEKPQEEVPSYSGKSKVNTEQAKMELFWKLMDMGFSRERTVEAVHEKGFTEVESAAEYLLTTGNLEGYSVEKIAPKEHKYELKPFHPHNQAQFCKAVSREANLLKSSLPDGIYVRAFEDRMDLYSVMIKGPHKTPYEDGLFFFDVQLSTSYPKLPPSFHYHSYSRRLNPNLYVDGKVCVSLLGTWSGQGSENWDSNNSNLLQVLVSIQGLILVSEPYFNEPGYASQKGTPQGDKKSREYNEMVLLENLTSLTRLAENPPPLFHNEVREHLNETWNSLSRRLEYWDEKCKTVRDSAQNKENPLCRVLVEPLQGSSSDQGSSTQLPDFPLAPLSSPFSNSLKRHLEIFDKSVQKLVNKNVLSANVDSRKETM